MPNPHFYVIGGSCLSSLLSSVSEEEIPMEYLWNVEDCKLKFCYNLNIHRFLSVRFVCVWELSDVWRDKVIVYRKQTVHPLYRSVHLTLIADV